MMMQCHGPIMPAHREPVATTGVRMILHSGAFTHIRRLMLVVCCTLSLTGCDGDRVAVTDNPAPAATQIDETPKKLSRQWHQPVARSADIETLLAQPTIHGASEIPFAVLRSKSSTGQVFFDLQTSKSQLRLADGTRVSFPKPGVPVSLQRISATRFVIAFRGIPRNTLSMINWDTTTGAITQAAVERKGVDYVMFRGGLVLGPHLFWVVYDNHARKNLLRQFALRAGTWREVAPELELPTLQDPAGTNYEMEPPLFLIDENGSLRIVGGTLNALLTDKHWDIRRTPDCRRAVEAIGSPAGVVILCNRPVADAQGAYVLHSPYEATPTLVPNVQGVPWNLRWNPDSAAVEHERARDARAYSQLLEFDISRSQNSGLLDFGSDNIEGRIPWSQIYYLNGLLDLVYMARRDDKALDVFLPMLRQIRMRLEMEIRLLDRLLTDPGALASRAFTKNRVPAIFAVQSGRFLLLMDRYRNEFPDAPPLVNHDRLRAQVVGLKHHIEKLSTSGESPAWIKPGTSHLRWPRGSAFFFDGLAVPYNHQNEWCYAVFETSRRLNVARDAPSLEPQREIIRHFVDRLSPDGGFPEIANWKYWWGHAYDGYTASADLSINKPDYVGDKSLAWISFRTIDLMSVLSGVDFLPDLDRGKLVTTAMARVENGEVYPFAARSLHDMGNSPGLMESVAHTYARSGAPWELSNQPWALATLPAADKK